MASLKLFPVGYVSTNNSSSKGSWTDGGSAVNDLFEPNNGCNKIRRGFTAMSDMENRAIWTRKIGEYKHTFEYRYNDIWTSEYKLVKRFITDIADHRVNSFYVVDFSSGVKVTNFAESGGNYTTTLPDTTDFTATPGYGGNYACVWNAENKQFRLGIISSYTEDTNIVWPDSTDYGNLTTFSADKLMAYPVYRVYLLNDESTFNVTAFAPQNETASYAGAMRSGNVLFVQRDTK